MQHATESSDNALWRFQFTFPNANNMPSELAQFSGNGTIADGIALNLLLPETRICLRREVPIAVMTMPETSVDEQNDPFLLPGEVRVPRDFDVSSPSGKLVFAQYGDHA